MRIAHWQAFAPLCPRCLRATGAEHALVLRPEPDTGAGPIRQGFAACPDAACQQRYPIVDGVPILVPDVLEYLRGWAVQILQRDDLDAGVSALIGDALPVSDGYQLVRQYLSTYAWDAYSQFDPELDPGHPRAAGV